MSWLKAVIFGRSGESNNRPKALHDPSPFFRTTEQFQMSHLLGPLLLTSCVFCALVDTRAEMCDLVAISDLKKLGDDGGGRRERREV